MNRDDLARPIRQSRGLAGRAYARLEQMIVSLELAPGSVWSEAELSGKLGIGRTPVREALQRLEDDHLVTILQRHGARITEINVAEHLLLLELRRELERTIARLAARRCTAEERAALREMAETLETRTADGGHIESYLRDQKEIKDFLAECARNPFVARAAMPCYAMSRRFYSLHHWRTGDLSAATKLHKHNAELARTIAAGDEAKAMTASERMMDYVEEFTRATLTHRF
jgi:DNA-binding GntR family transcriptional regulator